MNSFVKCLLFSFFAVVSCVFAEYKDSEYFEVKGIKTKQKGNNPLDAKREALAVGGRLAFKRVMENQLNQSASIVDKIPDRLIQDCYLDYSIDQEKFSDHFYIGEFSYRFYRGKVVSLLKTYGIKVDLKEKQDEIVKFGVYTKDFIYRGKDLLKLRPFVEKFSNDQVIFSISRKNVDNFRKLHIKYAKLS